MAQEESKMKHGLGDRIIHFEPLAEEFDLSVRYTKTIVYKGEEKLFKHLERRKDG